MSTPLLSSCLRGMAAALALAALSACGGGDLEAVAPDLPLAGAWYGEGSRSAWQFQPGADARSGSGTLHEGSADGLECRVTEFSYAQAPGAGTLHYQISRRWGSWSGEAYDSGPEALAPLEAEVLHAADHLTLAGAEHVASQSLPAGCQGL